MSTPSKQARALIRAGQQEIAKTLERRKRRVEWRGEYDATHQLWVDGYHVGTFGFVYSDPFLSPRPTGQIHFRTVTVRQDVHPWAIVMKARTFKTGRAPLPVHKICDYVELIVDAQRDKGDVADASARALAEGKESVARLATLHPRAASCISCNEEGKLLVSIWDLDEVQAAHVLEAIAAVIA